MISNRKHSRYNRGVIESTEPSSSSTIHLKLENGKRYSHTSSCGYQIMMASLQPNDRKQPNCACDTINKDKRKTNLDDKVVLIIEHNLEEHILCILDSEQLPQCKLNVRIQAGEQVSFRTVGKIPIQLTGVTFATL